MAEFWGGGGNGGGREGEASGSGSYGGGGTGGKLRTSRPARRGAAATPYDRPQTGRHAPAAVRAAARGDGGGGSWVWKAVVDPASRLINNSAVKWFSTVFRNRALPPQAQTQEVQDERLQEVEEEAVEDTVLTEVVDKEGEIKPVENQRNESEIAGLEQLLKNKTLSREEFNHLIGVLQSRVVDDTTGMENHENKMRELNGRNEAKNVQIAETQRWRDERKRTGEEKDNPSWDNGLFPNVLSPSVTENVFDEAGSTPADIAKAYMGVRSHRAPTSSLRLQRRPLRNESTPNRLFRDEHTQDRSSAYQLITRTEESELFGNGQVAERLKTPCHRPNSLQLLRSQNRVQGRNYTPYSRNFRQQGHSQHIGDVTSSSTPISQWTPIQSPLTGGRQMLKKRSGSMLDEGMTSGGPLRRIRQKTTFYTPLRNSDPSCSTSNQLNPFSLHANDFGPKTVAAVATKPMEIENQKFLSAFPFQEEGTKALTSNLGYVPQQSSETARKILEHLERMVPSPKEKSVESQLAIARSKPPTQLNVNMLNGHARRSVETVDKIAFLDMDGQITFSLQGNNQSRVQDVSDSKKIVEVNGNSPSKKSLETYVEVSKFHGTGDMALQQVEASSSKVDMNFQAFCRSVLQKENGFRMSAAEESDEECHVSKNDTNLVDSQTGNGTFISHGNSTDITTLKGDKAIPSISSSEANAATNATSAMVGPSTNILGFDRPVVPSKIFPEPTNSTSIPSPSRKGNIQTVTDNIAPTYNFSSTSPSKGPVFSFSTSLCTDVDTSKPEFDFKFESKPEETFSTAVAAAVSNLPNQPLLGSSEPLASVAKVASNPLFSGNFSSVSGPSSNFSTSTVAIPASGVKVSSGLGHKTDGNNNLSSISSSSSNFSTATVGLPASGVKVFNNPLHMTNGSSSMTFLPPGTSSSLTFGNTSPLLFGSSAATSESSGSVAASPFGLTVSSSSSSGSLSSAGFNANPFCVNTSAPLFSSSTKVNEAATTTTNGAPRSTLLGSSGSSFGASSVPSFGASSVPSFGLINTHQFGSNTSVSFGLSTTLQSSTSPFSGLNSCPKSGFNASPLFGSSSTSQFVSNTSISPGSDMMFDENTSGFATGSSPFGSASGPIFSSGSTFGSGNLSFGGNTVSFASSSNTALGASSASFSSASISPFGGSIASFGSSSLPASGGSSASFSSASASPFGGNIASFGSSSLSASGGSSASFSSASTPLFNGSIASFGSSSLPASGGSSSLFGSASNPMFGSNSNAPFGAPQLFGASSAASSSQSSATLFGSGFGSTPALGSTGFSFGGSVATSSGSFPVGASSGTGSGIFTFGSKDTTILAPQSIFGLGNSNPAFGATTSTPPTDQMEDSMAEDLTQVSTPLLFGGQSASSTPGFMFSSQQNAPPSFMFNSQPSPQVTNPFAADGQGTFTPPAGALEFSGGSFSLGATGEKPGRKFVRVKRGDKGRKK